MESGDKQLPRISVHREGGKERTVISEGISNNVLIAALMWGSLAFCF